jgi:hypothetical protein
MQQLEPGVPALQHTQPKLPQQAAWPLTDDSAQTCSHSHTCYDCKNQSHIMFYQITSDCCMSGSGLLGNPPFA